MPDDDPTPAAAPAEPPPLAPLWDDPDEGYAVPLAAIRGTDVFRCPPEDEDQRRIAFVIHVRPECSYTELLAEVGGGRYHLKARHPHNGHYLCQRRISLEGPPRSRALPAVAPPAALPVQETPGGLIAVADLPPQLQMMFTQAQIISAQVREDWRLQNERLFELLKAAITRPSEPVASPDLQLLQGQLAAMREELKALRESESKERDQRWKLALERARADRSGTDPLAILASKLGDKWDDVAGLIATVLSGGKVKVQTGVGQLEVGVTASPVNGAAKG